MRVLKLLSSFLAFCLVLWFLFAGYRADGHQRSYRENSNSSYELSYSGRTVWKKLRLEPDFDIGDAERIVVSCRKIFEDGTFYIIRDAKSNQEFLIYVDLNAAAMTQIKKD